jgi:hypothetical protein
MRVGELRLFAGQIGARSRERSLRASTLLAGPACRLGIDGREGCASAGAADRSDARHSGVRPGVV